MTLNPAVPLTSAATPPSGRDWASILAGEALVCGLIGKLLIDDLQPAWLQGLINDGVFDEIPFGAEQPDVIEGLKLLQKWAIPHRTGAQDPEFLKMRSDYTRLFIGPGKLPAIPWESAALDPDRQLFQPRTLDVRRWYRRFGLEPVRLYNEPDDHVGLELAFLAHLAQQGLAALDQGDEAQLNETLTAQREFLAAHPLQWIPAWCAQVEASAETDFFRGLARLTRGVLAELAAVFNPSLRLEAA
jgi:TorA maturation chaperone TorD